MKISSEQTKRNYELVALLLSLSFLSTCLTANIMLFQKANQAVATIHQVLGAK